MFKSASLVLALLASSALASPLGERASCSSIDTSTHTGQYDSVTAGQYELLLDQWGKSGASSGSGSAALKSLCGSTIAWTTTSNWQGGSGVKSFTNIQLNSGINQKLSAISSMPSTWTWSESTSGSIVADVAYDLFTSNTAGGSNQYEIMIWLANYNAGPISAAYGSNGQPTPVASSISLAGHTWNLYHGSNGQNQVFSFLPTSGTINSFSGDIKTFFNYLTSSQGLSSSQYLITAQAGTEATSGTQTLTTSAYSLAIN